MKTLIAAIILVQLVGCANMAALGRKPDRAAWDPCDTCGTLLDKIPPWTGS